jgi:hypothetical protein
LAFFSGDEFHPKRKIVMYYVKGVEIIHRRANSSSKDIGLKRVKMVAKARNGPVSL